MGTDEIDRQARRAVWRQNRIIGPLMALGFLLSVVVVLTGGDPRGAPPAGEIDISYIWATDGSIDVKLFDGSQDGEHVRALTTALAPALFPEGTAVTTDVRKDDKGSRYSGIVTTSPGPASILTIDARRLADELTVAGFTTARISVGAPHVEQVASSNSSTATFNGHGIYDRLPSGGAIYRVELSPDPGPAVAKLVSAYALALILLAFVIVTGHRSARDQISDRAATQRLLFALGSGFCLCFAAMALSLGFVDEVLVAQPRLSSARFIIEWFAVLTALFSVGWSFLALLAIPVRRQIRDAARSST